jgi:hypothetical protein
MGHPALECAQEDSFVRNRTLPGGVFPPAGSGDPLLGDLIQKQNRDATWGTGFSFGLKARFLLFWFMNDSLKKRKGSL